MSVPRDRGFALIAVLIASVALAGLAYDLLLQNRTAIVEAQAQVDRAQLEAAAESGLALVLDQLSRGPADARWPIDGTLRDLNENGVALAITVEDERGKIPLNVLSEQEVRRMFEAAGARGPAIDTLSDSFLDWRDDDSERRPFGAETDDYAPNGYRARDGDVTAIGELARINGMTPTVYARLVPAVTLWFGESGGFVERNADRLALAVMSGAAEGAPPSTVGHRRGGGAGDRGEGDDALRGRRLTVRILARDTRGGILHRATVIELTGNPARSLWIRERD